MTNLTKTFQTNHTLKKDRHSSNEVNEMPTENTAEDETEEHPIQESCQTKGAPANRQCAIEGCQKYRAAGRDGMCRSHFNEKQGKPPKVVSKSKHAVTPAHRQCKLEGCVRYFRHGCDRLCKMHYNERMAETKAPLMCATDNTMSASINVDQSSMKRSDLSRSSSPTGKMPDNLGKSADKMVTRNDHEPPSSVKKGHTPIKRSKSSSSMPSSVSTISSIKNRESKIHGRKKSRHDESKTNQKRHSHELNKRESRQCTAPGCHKYFIGRWTNYFCRKHYDEWIEKSQYDIDSRSTVFESEQRPYNSNNKSVQCIIKGCTRKAKTLSCCCRRHSRTFGTCPPTEMKRIGVNVDAIANDSKTLYDKYTKLYRYYKVVTKNRDWDHLYSTKGNDKKPPANMCFSLQQQKEFAMVRKELIERTKIEQNEYIMNKRRAREHRKDPKQPSDASPLARLLNGEQMIPEEMARQIVRNVSKSGMHGNVRDAVIAEARTMLQLDDEDQKAMQETMYKHMPIDKIDNLVSWSHSRQGDFPTKSLNTTTEDGENGEEEYPYFGHASTTPPPMPSEIAFLRQMIEKKLVERVRILHPDDNDDENSERARKMSNRIDISASVALGVSIEEITTKALMPLARAYVEHSRKHEQILDLESKNNSSQTQHDVNNQQPFSLLPISEALCNLSSSRNDPSA